MGYQIGVYFNKVPLRVTNKKFEKKTDLPRFVFLVASSQERSDFCSLRCRSVRLVVSWLVVNKFQFSKFYRISKIPKPNRFRTIWGTCEILSPVIRCLLVLLRVTNTRLHLWVEIFWKMIISSFNFSCIHNQFLQIYARAERKGDQQSLVFRHNYACSQCEKRYTEKRSLDRHMQLHTGKFSYYCNICGKGFNAGDHYKDHVRAHQGLKYHCEYCSKPFMTTQAYKKHVSLHWRLKLKANYFVGMLLKQSVSYTCSFLMLLSISCIFF